ncbi:MAG: hypothetical protein LUO89_11645 [Methanothrix sp.]|nr:hypothetical protein [Methanothrix sp.]
MVLGKTGLRSYLLLPTFGRVPVNVNRQLPANPCLMIGLDCPLSLSKTMLMTALCIL